MSDLVLELANVWKELMPHESYVGGWTDSGGRIFLPDKGTVGSIEERLSSLWSETSDLSHRSLLRWARTRVRVPEPHQGVEEVIQAATGHLMRSGPGSPDMGRLLISASRRLDLDMDRFPADDVPLEMRFLVLDRLTLLGSLIKNLPESFQYSRERDALLSGMERMSALYKIPDLKESRVHEPLQLLDTGDGTLGRDATFDTILQDLHSFSIRKEQIESELQVELYRTIPRFKVNMKKMSDELGVEMDMDEIDTAMVWELRVGKGHIMDFISDHREALLSWLDRTFMDVPRTAPLRMVEAPPYLSPFVGAGFMFNYNGLVGSPSSLFFIDKRDRRSSELSIPRLSLMVLREDAASRTAYLNSFRNISLEETLPDLLERPSTRSTADAFILFVEDTAISRAFELMDEGSEVLGRTLTSVKGDFRVEDLVISIQYLSVRDRVLSLISGICDVRVNSGKQTLPDMVRWAHIITGIGTGPILRACTKALVYPGRPSTSLMTHRSIRGLHEKWLGEGASTRDFLRRLSSVGYPELRRLVDIMDYKESSTFSR
ncbi:MAG: hypothetical protein R6V01_06360 [Thermoplasmatota archaeon]